MEKRKLTEEQTSNKKSKNDILCKDLQNIKTGGLRNNFHGDMYQLSLLIIAAYRAHTAKKEFLIISEAEKFGKFDDLVNLTIW